MFQLLINILPKDEKGQDLAEYALLIGLIALVVVASITALGGGLNTVFVSITSAIQGSL